VEHINVIAKGHLLRLQMSTVHKFFLWRRTKFSVLCSMYNYSNFNYCSTTVYNRKLSFKETII